MRDLQIQVTLQKWNAIRGTVIVLFTMGSIDLWEESPGFQLLLFLSWNGHGNSGSRDQGESRSPDPKTPQFPSPHRAVSPSLECRLTVLLVLFLAPHLLQSFLTSNRTSTGRLYNLVLRLLRCELNLLGWGKPGTKVSHFLGNYLSLPLGKSWDFCALSAQLCILFSSIWCLTPVMVQDSSSTPS